MTAADIIKQVEDDASEWLEMAENPAEIVSVVLANKIVGLNIYIAYLERRLENECSYASRIN